MGKLTAPDIVARITVAFPPHRVEAEHWDYQHKIKFRVFSAQDGSVLLEVPDLLVRGVNTGKTLEDALDVWRQAIEPGK